METSTKSKPLARTPKRIVAGLGMFLAIPASLLAICLGVALTGALIIIGGGSLYAIAHHIFNEALIPAATYISNQKSILLMTYSMGIVGITSLAIGDRNYGLAVLVVSIGIASFIGWSI